MCYFSQVQHFQLTWLFSESVFVTILEHWTTGILSPKCNTKRCWERRNWIDCFIQWSEGLCVHATDSPRESALHKPCSLNEGKTVTYFEPEEHGKNGTEHNYSDSVTFRTHFWLAGETGFGEANSHVVICLRQRPQPGAIGSVQDLGMSRAGRWRETQTFIQPVTKNCILPTPEGLWKKSLPQSNHQRRPQPDNSLIFIWRNPEQRTLLSFAQTPDPGNLLNDQTTLFEAKCVCWNGTLPQSFDSRRSANDTNNVPKIEVLYFLF